MSLVSVVVASPSLLWLHRQGFGPGDLARYVWTVLHGMAIDAVDGATRPQLRAVAKHAMLAWPAPPKRRRAET